ncbi:accessory gland protein Acp62F-like [Anopheles maculipalpis]|uniref:accessory gland protein Acp62F-like n=1 Tax=Anopheles maculipalpis TaxID=1496333 RepID=UPI0021592145|nr:accessory gland protein Acp62F-like [Anopheles maculipalpis]
MQTMRTFIGLMLLITLYVGSSTAVSYTCPPNAEFTSSAPCEYFCGIPCDYKGVTNVCICRDGYMKDPNTMQCVSESQCTIAAEIPSLRSAPSFTFSCFST